MAAANQADAPFSWDEGSALVADLGRGEHALRRISEELDRRQWTQARLLKAINEVVFEDGDQSRRLRDGDMHPSTLSRLLNDSPDQKRQLSIDQLLVIAKALEVPVGELLLPRGMRDRYEAWRLLKVAAELRARIAADEYELEKLTSRLAEVARESDDFKTDLSNTIAGFQRRDEEFLTKVWENDSEAMRQLGKEPPSRPSLNDWAPSPWEQVCSLILARAESDG